MADSVFRGGTGWRHPPRVVALLKPSRHEAVVTSPQSPLAYRDFRLFWIARFAAVFATMAMVVVIGWQVYDIARSDYGMTPKQAAFQLGLIGIAQFLPLLRSPSRCWQLEHRILI